MNNISDSKISTELTLTERLEKAASHPNISEALTALCTWASFSDPNTLQQFFDGRSLEIIVEAILAEPSLGNRASDVYLGFTSLLQHVLPLSAEQSAISLSPIMDSLIALQHHVVNLRSLIATDKAVVSPLSQRVSMSIRRLHHALSSHKGRSVQATLANLDAALADTTAALDKHAEECRSEALRQPLQFDLKSAFIHRELQHERLQLELQVCLVVCVA